MADHWAEIRPSGAPGTVHVRRADPDHPLDLFRGRDHQGNYIFSFTGRFPQPDALELPRLAILDLALTHRPDGLSELTIRLLDRSQFDIFRALCADLLAATEHLPRRDDGAGIQIILTRLRRWRELLRARHDRRLSDAEVIGLFGELLLLRDTFLVHLQPGNAVAAWRGPYMEEQDFSLREWLIEVKTQVASADSTIQISSENQLDSRSGRILLCHQTVAHDSADDPVARTLNSLVAEITGRLSATSPAACDRFLATLCEFGYRELQDYDRDAWTPHDRSFYLVADGFPKITRGDLRQGVEGVRYGIRLDSCEPFRVSERDVVDWVFAQHG